MNELIKQLAKQSGIQMFEDKSFGWSVLAGTDNNLKKFAELIVKECAEICLEANDHKNILRHFGVELDVNETLRNRSTYFGNDI
jgi:hypothetical protein